MLTRMRRRLLIGGAATALVITLPGLAMAATALNYDQAVTGTTSATYDATTSTRVWSVVSVRSQSGSDFDINVSADSGSYISQRAIGTDFVLIDSSPDAHAPATYPVGVVRYSGSGQYSLIHTRARSVITKPTNLRPSWWRNVYTTSREAPVTLVPIRLAVDEGFRVKFPAGTKVLLTRSAITPVPPFLESRQRTEDRGILGPNVFGSWIVGDSTTGGCAAFGSPDNTDDWILILIDDEPLGSAGKTFNLYSYNRWTDPQNQC